MRDRDWREVRCAYEHCRARCHLEEQLHHEPNGAKRNQAAALRFHRQQQREERGVDAGEAAVGGHVRGKGEDGDGDHDDAGEQRRLERPAVAPRTGDAEDQENERVPGELLIREVREMTGDDPPHRAAALQLERRAGD